MSDDWPRRGDGRFRAGGDFLQSLVKGGEIGWTPFLGSLGCATHGRGPLGATGQKPYRPSAWMAFGRPTAPAKSSLAANSSRTIKALLAYRTPGKQVVAGPHDHPVPGRIEYASVRVLTIGHPPATSPAGGLFLFTLLAGFGYTDWHGRGTGRRKVVKSVFARCRPPLGGAMAGRY